MYSKTLFKKLLFRTKILLFISILFIMIGVILIGFQYRTPVEVVSLLNDKSLRYLDVVYINDYQLLEIIDYGDKEYSILRVNTQADIYYLTVEGTYDGIRFVENKFIGRMDDPLYVIVSNCLENLEIEEGEVLSYTLNDMPTIGIPILGIGLFGVIVGGLILLIITKDYTALFGSEFVDGVSKESRGRFF